MRRKHAKVLLKRAEAIRLLEVLDLIAWAGDECELPVGRIDYFVGSLTDALKAVGGDTVSVRITAAVWGELMHATGELCLNSFYGDTSAEELAAIDYAFEFLIASGRKLDRSIWVSPENRKKFEDAFGAKLDHLE